MTYFIQACVKDGHIFTVRSQASPVNGLAVENPIDFAVNAEIEGDYRDAGEILPLLSLDGQTLAGLEIVAQEAVTP